MSPSEQTPSPAEVAEAISQMHGASAATRSATAGGKPSGMKRVIGVFRRWFLTHTFTPRSFSGFWTHPIFGYLIGVILQLIVMSGILAVMRVYATFRFPEGPLLLVVLLIALEWGAGPSIVATLVGAALLAYFILPPYFSIVITQKEDIIGLLLYLVVGFTISVLASQVQRAERLASERARQLEAIFNVTDRQEEQERFLAEVGKVLTSTLDYNKTLSSIARLVVPELADWFAVDLVDANGNFQLVEIDHINPDKVKWARELREKYPVDPSTPTGLPNVVRTGRSELYAHITDEMLAATARSEEELSLSRQLGITSIMLVPLLARGQTIGVVTYVSAESGRRYTERDVAMAEEVGRRAGIALDNARLYREVQQARNQLEIILQGVADGIVVYDSNSKVFYANETAAQMNGFASVQEMMGTSSLDVVAQYEVIDEHGKPFTSSQLTHKRVFAGEKEAQAIIGSRDKAMRRPEHWSIVKSRPVYDDQGKVIFAITIIHNITERMQTERRKDEFISMASHELKTPVTSLKGFTHVLQRRLAKQGDEQGLHYLARMDAQLTRLTNLVNDLLDISKMQSGKLSLHEEECDLDALVLETVENVQATTTTHQLQVEGKTQARIWGDRDRLGQVFINLLTNAIKYSPTANIVRVCVSRDEAQAIVSVQDFGLGIDEAHHAKIFERFYQVTDPEEKTYPGLGIGLFISNEIVERHHGRLWLKSGKGAGSTFYVALPILHQEA